MKKKSHKRKRTTIRERQDIKRKQRNRDVTSSLTLPSKKQHANKIPSISHTPDIDSVSTNAAPTNPAPINPAPINLEPINIAPTNPSSCVDSAVKETSIDHKNFPTSEINEYRCSSTRRKTTKIIHQTIALQNLSNKKKTRLLRVPFRHKVHHVHVEFRDTCCPVDCVDYLNQVSLVVRTNFDSSRKKRTKITNHFSAKVNSAGERS